MLKISQELSNFLKDHICHISKKLIDAFVIRSVQMSIQFFP